jgi:hypothetical protein
MSNSSIDNKLNEINDRNRQNPQNEPDEEENMSGFEKGRLAALNAKYEDDDEPKKRNQNNEGSTGENSEGEKGEEEKEDEEEKDPEEEKDDEPEKDNDDDPKENNDDNKKDTDDNKKDNNEPESQIPKPWRNGPINKAKNKAKEWVKKNTEVIKQKAKKAVQAGAKKAAATVAKLAAKLGLGALPPVLIIVLIIVAIIFIIGIISFFSIMGDMIIGKLKNFFQGVWDAIQTVTTGDQADANINAEHVKNAASYLEQMGYDLVGMGFVKTEYNTTNKNEGEAWNKWYNENGELIEEKSASNKKEDLIEREEDTTEDESEGEKSGAEQKDPIKKIKSEPIRKYLVAALRSYINGAYGGMVVQEGHEADGLWNTVFDKIAFNSKEHTLTVTKGDTHVKVNLESWTAKYGMSFEFLVCLHLGTLAPEFVMDLAGDADNRVKVVVNFFKQERNKKI